MGSYTYSGTTQQNSNSGHPNLMVALKVDPAGTPKVSILAQTVADANGDFTLQWGTDHGGEDWAGRVAIGALDDDGTVQLDCVFHDWKVGSAAVIQTYEQLINSLSPFGYWRLGESSGATAVDETTANDGTYIGSPGLAAVGLLANDADTAVDFDAVDDEVRLGALGTDSLADVSISAIIKPDDLTSEQVIYKEGGSSNGLALGIYNSNFRMSVVQSGTVKAADFSTAGFSVGDTIFIGGKVTSAGVYLYINGVEVASNVQAIGGHNGTCEAAIGSAWCPGSSNNQSPLTASNNAAKFNGVIDDVAVFNSALPESDFLTMYLVGAGYADTLYGSVLVDTPDFYWRLNDTTTAVADEQGNYPGTLSGTYTQSTPHLVPGDGDDSITFSTASGYAYTNASFVNPQTFTLEAVINTTSITSGVIMGFASTQSPGAASRDRLLYLDSNGKVKFGTHPSTGMITSTTSVNDGNEHHIVVICNAGSCELFIDGVSEGTVSQAPASYTGYWLVGNVSLSSWPDGGTDQFDGVIDEVAYYSSALDQARITAHADAVIDLYRSRVLADTPTLYWRLDEAAGPTISDSSGNTNHGTITGTLSHQQAGLLIGDSNEAAGFDATDYITSDTQFTNPQTFSIEAVVKTSSASSGVIVGFSDVTGNSGASSWDRILYLGSDGKAVFGVFSGSQVVVTSSGVINDGNEHHLVATCDGSTIELFVDGISQGTAAARHGERSDGA